DRDTATPADAPPPVDATEVPVVVRSGVDVERVRTGPHEHDRIALRPGGIAVDADDQVVARVLGTASFDVSLVPTQRIVDELVQFLVPTVHATTADVVLPVLGVLGD